MVRWRIVQGRVTDRSAEWSSADGPGTRVLTPPRASLGSVAARILVHGGFLLIALACLAAYEHFKIRGQSEASLASLVAAAVTIAGTRGR
jgi:hypothetical protein